MITVRDFIEMVAVQLQEGGPGSGHWGHAGIKGHRGGSLPSKTGVGAAMSLKTGPTAEERRLAAKAGVPKEQPREETPQEKEARIIRTLTNEENKGKLWENYGKRRIYFNDLLNFAGLDLAYYKTGHISSARYKGKSISNSEGYRVLAALGHTKLWYDLDRVGWYSQNAPSPGNKYYSDFEGYLHKLQAAIK